MITTRSPFCGFSVDETDRVAPFYREVLGLRVDESEGMLTLHLGEGSPVLVYPKGPGHVPASYTVLNFPVPDIDAAVAELTAAGVTFERYPSMAEHTEASGIVRGPHGPAIAWFTDPAGNVFSVLQES
ncbi:VOC family protein [Actinotalea sp.]|uniref:VOC family protein n=1 Tax=Actinotalea sp. TaxID=1872145 RepID=UPI0035691229